MITVTVYADEILFRLDQLPKKIRGALETKYEEIFAELRERMFQNPPGKFVDPEYVQSGVEAQGSTLIGFIEAEDKPGTYPINPSKARALRFLTKDGTLIRTKHVNHPFMKGTPIVERLLLESKPWILDQLEMGVEGAIR